MATLAGVIPSVALSGIVNPLLTNALHGFDASDIVGWPAYEAIAPNSLDAAAIITHWPVEANGRELSGFRAGGYGDDYYNRIHISISELDLGNVVTTQTTPIYVWNAFFSSKTLTEITGVDEGIEISGQSEPPLLYAALQEREYLLSVTNQGSAVIDNTLSWVFDEDSTDTESAVLLLTGTRIIAFAFAPDWGSGESDGITETLSWLTDILCSESYVEQRRALRIAPRRTFSATLYAYGQERQLLDLALFGWGARVWALPIWPDIQRLSSAVALGATRIDCETANLDFAVGSLALLRGESALAYEAVEIAAIDSSGLDLARETQAAWPAGTRLYPARQARLTEQPTLKRLTDRLVSAEVSFLVVEPCDWTEALPDARYRERPVYEERPDESDDLTSQYQRLLLTLDNSSAIPLLTDTASQPMPLQQHKWLDAGRAQRASLRSLAYALRGQQGALWLPTHADDLTLLADIADTDDTLDVAYCGYTRFAYAQPGRRDIRIELWDGTVFYRRITGSTEIDGSTERLSLDSALGQAVAMTEVMRISYLMLCRLASDEVEILHLTDSEGAASCSLSFVGVRDDEF